jgi:diguanylate cyclase (GGDEF)-like protein
MLLDEDTDDPELRIVEARGISEDIISLARRKLGEGVAGWVAQHGKMMFKGPSGKNMEGKGSGSYEDDTFVSVPLKAKDEIFGVVNITEGLSSDDFTTQKLNALSLLARHAAVWINYCQTLQKLKKLSLMDEMTSLYNRRFFDDALEREIQRVGRSGGQMSLAILDIDHFKIYNDTYGHLAGDRILKEFASLLRSNVRTTDFTCRFGGEEFAIILTDTGKEPQREESNAHFINRLRYLIDKHQFEGEEILPGGSLTVSAGVADYPSDAGSAEELVAVADKRLYEAKNSGRNKICA